MTQSRHVTQPRHVTRGMLQVRYLEAGDRVLVRNTEEDRYIVMLYYTVLYCTVLCCTGLTSWNTLNLGWRYCAICAVRLPWVSSTPFATPVVPLL